MAQRLVKANTSVSNNEVYGRVRLGRTPKRMPGEPFRRKLKKKVVRGNKRRSFLNLGKVKRS